MDFSDSEQNMEIDFHSLVSPLKLNQYVKGFVKSDTNRINS